MAVEELHLQQKEKIRVYVLARELNIDTKDLLELCKRHGLDVRNQLSSLEPIPVEMLPGWRTLQQQELAKTPFWWGGKGQEGFVWRTYGIRSFLGITEPSFRAFKTAKTEERSREAHYFGLWDHAQRSLVLAKDDWLMAYGSVVAKERLLHKVRQWVDLGMPSAASFALQVYPRDVPLSAGAQQWIVTRRESQFHWSLAM